MLYLLKNLVQQCDVLEAPAVAQDSKTERDWPPQYHG